MYINAEEYLDDIRRKGNEIKSLRNALSAIDKDLEASAITYDPNRAHSNVPRKDGLEELAFKHLERRDRVIKALESAITERSEAIEEAVKYIRQIESDDQKEVLMLRYIESRSWSEILDIRECDDIRNQCRLRDRAIESLQKIIEKEMVLNNPS